MSFHSHTILALPCPFISILTFQIVVFNVRSTQVTGTVSGYLQDEVDIICVALLYFKALDSIYQSPRWRCLIIPGCWCG
jgi:hypothetical protein